MGTTTSACENVCDTNNVRKGDTAWIIVSGTLVMIMTPGLGYFYGGMARQKHFLSTLMSSMLALAVVSVQWFIWGYSLTFSMNSNNSFIGNFDRAFLEGVGEVPHYNAQTIPENTYMFYQLMFAVITPALAFGGAAERATMNSLLVFLFTWSTFVYNFVAYWAWNPNGWLHKLGALDFAGGGPVHLASGSAALAYALALGPRSGYAPGRFRPHSLSHVILGTSLLWFGWFGFNGGSTDNATARASNATMVTHLSASVGGLTSMLLDYRFGENRKFSSFGFCFGAVSGLVTITPGAGYVTPASSLAIGFFGALGCWSASHLKKYFTFDDSFDVFAVHGVGGALGSILTGIFAQQSVFTLDDTPPLAAGWISGHWIQVGYQLAAICTIGSWSFFVTGIIILGMDKLGLKTRVGDVGEERGTDFWEMGEEAYPAESPHGRNNIAELVHSRPILEAEQKEPFSLSTYS